MSKKAKAEVTDESAVTVMDDVLAENMAKLGKPRIYALFSFQDADSDTE